MLWSVVEIWPKIYTHSEHELGLRLLVTFRRHAGKHQPAGWPTPFHIGMAGSNTQGRGFTGKGDTSFQLAKPFLTIGG